MCVGSTCTARGSGGMPFQKIRGSEVVQNFLRTDVSYCASCSLMQSVISPCIYLGHGYFKFGNVIGQNEGEYFQYIVALVFQ